MRLIYELSRPGRRAGRPPRTELPIPEIPPELRRSEPPRLSALYGRCHELGQTAAANLLHFWTWNATRSPVNVCWCAPVPCCSVSS